MSKRVFDFQAPAVAQVDKATPATVEVDDIFSIELQNHDGDSHTIVFVATAATPANVVTGLQAAAVAAKGANLAPWGEVTTTDDTTHLTITADVAGVPNWPTSSAVDGGGADTQTMPMATLTAVGGPGIWLDVGNWQGTLYIAGDDIRIRANSDEEIIYGVDATGININTFFTEDYSEVIGSISRPLKLKFTGQADQKVIIAGTGRKSIYLEEAAYVEVKQADSTSEGEAGINITGIIIELEIELTSGTASVAGQLGETAAVDIIYCQSGELTIGEGVTDIAVTDIDQVNVAGGICICRASAKAIINEGDGGDLTYKGGDVANVTSWAGAIFWDTDANITTLLKNGQAGEIDFSVNRVAKLVEAAELSEGYNIRDPFKSVTWTNGRQLVGCGRDDGAVDLGNDYNENNS